MIRDFPLTLLTLACAGLPSTPAIALQQPSAGQRDARVRVVTYVIRASTQMVFADDEEIAHVAIGDSVAWEVALAGSILFLKPREKHYPTNPGRDHAGQRPQALLPIRAVDRGKLACRGLFRRGRRLSRRRDRAPPYRGGRSGSWARRGSDRRGFRQREL